MIDAAMTSPTAVPAAGVAGAAPAEPGFDAVLAALMGGPVAASAPQGESQPPTVPSAIADGTLAALLAAAVLTVDDGALADVPAEPGAEDASSGEAPAGDISAPAPDPALDAPIPTLSFDDPAAAPLDAPVLDLPVDAPIASLPLDEAAAVQPPAGDEMPPGAAADPQAVSVPRAAADAPGHAAERPRHAPRPRASARAIDVAAGASAVGRMVAETAEPSPASPADAAPSLPPVVADQAAVALSAAAAAAVARQPGPATDAPWSATAPVDAVSATNTATPATETGAIPAVSDEAEAALPAPSMPGEQVDQPTGFQGAGRAEAAASAPAARITDAGQPAEAFTALALRRVLDAVEAAEQRSPHTMRVDLPGEVAGDEVLHLIVSVRGHTVHVSAEGSRQDSLPQAWGQELADVLRRRGLELSGHAGGQDRRGREPNADEDHQPAPPAGSARRRAIQSLDGALRL